jgi:hypothetical protein
VPSHMSGQQVSSGRATLGRDTDPYGDLRRRSFILERVHRSGAASIVATSIFFIGIIASKARFASSPLSPNAVELKCESRSVINFATPIHPGDLKGDGDTLGRGPRRAATRSDPVFR